MPFERANLRADFVSEFVIEHVAPAVDFQFDHFVLSFQWVAGLQLRHPFRLEPNGADELFP